MKPEMEDSAMKYMIKGFSKDEAQKKVFGEKKETLKANKEFELYPELQKSWQKAIENIKDDEYGLFFEALEATNIVIPFVSANSQDLARKTIKSVKALRFFWFHIISIMLQNLETLEE